MDEENEKDEEDEGDEVDEGEDKEDQGNEEDEEDEGEDHKGKEKDEENENGGGMTGRLAGCLAVTVADWLAGWPRKPDYVVLEAVLGLLPKWLIGGGGV